MCFVFRGKAELCSVRESYNGINDLNRRRLVAGKGLGVEHWGDPKEGLITQSFLPELPYRTHWLKTVSVLLPNVSRIVAPVTKSHILAEIDKLQIQECSEPQ